MRAEPPVVSRPRLLDSSDDRVGVVSLTEEGFPRGFREQGVGKFLEDFPESRVSLVNPRIQFFLYVLIL